MGEVEIIPLCGAGKIQLGMSKGEIREAIGSTPDNIPSHTNSGIEFQECDYFLENAIQVSYSKDTGLVDWIGFNDNIPLKLLFHGNDLFSLEVNEVLAHIKKYGKLDENDPEIGYSYRFPELGISFWRESITEELVQELTEADEADKEWLQKDIETSKHFQQISVFK
ncbi:hypothetical protein [Photobacterium sp. OFAV2-7]|uniref:hypothetical protein n=1 Tax=Photobacterium sp. OFAV2-7 TaxID=2917748 RepID=UPI001EF4EFC7|nr:hypothetical protein [Photobacterium sp. OFAV2-7]MCG7586873.1 hypothetical protein [Photobacterium sp. OFAV2-7]